mgnify:CR=1 FL=1
MKAVRLALAAVLLGAAALLGVGNTAGAASVDAAAWWSVANAGPIVVPQPPDVAPGDLLVQGAASGTGIEGEGALRQAVAAVRFTLAPGEQPVVLALELASALPAGVSSVRACKLTAAFRSTENGPWAEVPAHDCGTSALGSVSGTTLVFSDIGAVATDDDVAVLLVPEGATRTVLRKPTAAALAVLAVPPDDAPASPDLGLVPPLPDAGTLLPLPDLSPPPVGSAPPEAQPAPAARPGFGSVEGASQFRDSTSEAGILVALAMFVLLSPLAARRRGVIA